MIFHLEDDKMNVKKITHIGLLAFALTLAGCGSSVKLSEVPVEDRAGSSAAGSGQAGAGAAGAGAAGAGAAGAASSGATPGRAVAPVDLTPRPAATAAVPTNLPRVIYFDFDSFAIRPEGEAVIEGHAKFLSANRGRSIAVEGHTDERGGREYNLALGQKRAEAVRRRLVLLGVADNQVEAVSFGKEKPAVSGADETAFEKNRRAEISYR
jgi:peptidoglycan-associated lipoprotein